MITRPRSLAPATVPRSTGMGIRAASPPLPPRLAPTPPVASRPVRARLVLIWLVLIWLVPAGLVVLLQPPSASAAWPHRRVAGPFVIQADFPLQGSDALLGELSRLQADLHRQLGVPPTREAIQLYWFADKLTYENYLRRHFPQVPIRRALFIKGSGPGMMLGHLGPEFEVDVRHECTHALLHAVLPSLPLWLDEGLAEYFEVRRDRRWAGNPHHAPARRALWQGEFPVLSELERHEELGALGLDDYRMAWAWTHFLLHGPAEAGDELRGYLRDLATGRPTEALSRRLARRIPDLEVRFRRHFLGSWTAR